MIAIKPELKRRHIPSELIPLAYKIARKVYDEKLKISAGVKALAGNDMMNANSARDYLSDFKCIMEGKKFTRTLNAESMEYFFDNISKDYRGGQLSIALSSLMKHIEYYENKQRTTMHQMRSIYKKYLSKTTPLELIGSIEELAQNIKTFEHYLTEGNEVERLIIINLIKKGTCFVAYSVGKELRFAPSRFLGYVDNNLERHQIADIDGRQTNKAITHVVKSKLEHSNSLERQYLKYCVDLGFNANASGTFGVKRKYWSLNIPSHLNKGDSIPAEFPEGKIKERIHKARERSPELIKLAKSNFKIKHGKLFCQICGFDFEKKYGEVGADFIEGHHTIAVETMPPDYKTKPEEIAMLCGNCHRMVHRKRPWLTMQNLKLLLK